MSPEGRRILETCLNQHGLEVWLLAGRVPLLRFPHCVREVLTGKPLWAEDIADIVLGGADKLRAFWRAHDFVRLDYSCDWCDARFRVFLVRHGDSVMATMTPISPDTPELEYLNDDSGSGPRDQPAAALNRPRE
jgi:hypothetical protein